MRSFLRQLVKFLCRGDIKITTGSLTTSSGDLPFSRRVEKNIENNAIYRKF